MSLSGLERVSVHPAYVVSAVVSRDPAPVRSALKRIRRKMREAGVAVSIDAVRGVGFRAAAPPV